MTFLYMIFYLDHSLKDLSNYIQFNYNIFSYFNILFEIQINNFPYKVVITKSFKKYLQFFRNYLI